MRREDMADVAAFAEVATERSFTAAAAKLGISQSALSQIVRRIEARLDVRLLQRTTRSVAPTEIGFRLLSTVEPALASLEAAITELGDIAGAPRGTIRITTVEHAAKTVLMPALADLLAEQSGIRLELSTDYAPTDIVGAGFDAGVRLGDQVEKDMIGMRISPDIPMAIVGSRAYFERYGVPAAPEDLLDHRCITLRLTQSTTLNSWRLTRDERRANVRVENTHVFNRIDLIRDAVRAGLGLAYLPRDVVGASLQDGRLRQVLADWTVALPGYHLYYANRRHPSRAFQLVLSALRHRN